MTQPTDSNRQMLLIMGLIAIVLLALGVGFLGGSLVGRDGSNQPQTSAQPATPQVPQSCAFELPVEDQWVLSGMICNCDEAACNRTPLLQCHCDTAHSMKALAKDLIQQGMGPEEIGVELEKRWGPGIAPVAQSGG